MTSLVQRFVNHNLLPRRRIDYTRLTCCERHRLERSLRQFPRLTPLLEARYIAGDAFDKPADFYHRKFYRSSVERGLATLNRYGAGRVFVEFSAADARSGNRNLNSRC